MIKKLLSDSFSSLLVPIVKAVITFIMAPVIVHSLGNYDYGVWEIVFSVVGYMGILDLGLSPAIVRYVARYNALKDTDELQKIFSTGLAFFLLLGLVISLIINIIAFSAPDLFISIPIGSTHKYSTFMSIIGCYVLLILIGTVFDCYLEGYQLYSVRNYTTLIILIVSSIVMYKTLSDGGGLLSLAVIYSVGGSIKYVLYWMLLRSKLYGSYVFRLSNISKRTFKYLINFGFKNFIYALSLTFTTLTDSLVIGAILGAAVVPFYIIPANLINQVRNLVWSSNRVFLPLFSELDAISDLHKTQNIYFVTSRYALGIFMPALVGIYLLGPYFLKFWMGSEYADKGTLVLYILSSAYLIQWLNPFSKRFLIGTANHEILAKVSIFTGIINLVSSICLVILIGKEGAAVGTLIPTVLFEPYLHYRTCKYLGSNMTQYANNVFKPLIMPIAIFIALEVAVVKAIAITSLTDVLTATIVGASIYIPLFVVFVMRSEDRNMVKLKITKTFA